MAIEPACRQYSRQELLDLLDPAVSEWFSSFSQLTPPQKLAIASIQAGRNTLIASPTGSGKTLSAFLTIIDELVKLARSYSLEDRTYCVYVSPLRSLNNDISKNLSKPLSEIREILNKEEPKRNLPEIRIAVRTSDTTQGERSKMLRKPPHILITTPETLAILLVAPKFRENLKKVRWVIVDEIHELCSSKRGVHLSLSLERLQSICETRFARVGLSATINPLSEVAKFLAGFEENGKERECVVVDARFAKQVEVTVSSPVPDLVHTEFDAISSEMYARLKDHVEKNKTTLVFTNTRSWAERVAFHLSKLQTSDADAIGAHHSSLSREHRKEVEDKLKGGEMKAVVTSTSLELGLDIGSIDSVFQIGSPKSITRFLQRIGRSGHSLDGVSKGVLLGLDRDDLLELAAISAEAQKGNLDKIYIPRCSLDVLAQHVVGMAIERNWQVEEAFNLVRQSFCFHDLEMEAFRRIICYLSGGYGLEEYRIYARIWHDGSNDTFGKRGWLTRVIYSTNIGTIPDKIAITVITRSSIWVGEIQEEFLEKLTPGDVFVLGGKMYKFCYARGFKAFVDQVEKGKPTVPSWSSEALPLSFELGEAVTRFKTEILMMLWTGKSDQVILDFICLVTSCDLFAAESILSYIKAQHQFLKFGGLNEPIDEKTIVVENYVDIDLRQNIIFSCDFGRRVNEVLARVLAYRISERRKGNVLVTVADSGFMITLPVGVYIQPKVAVELFRSDAIRSSLACAIRRSEMVRRRFRHCCGRALMILKNYKGNSISVRRQQVSSQILLSLCERLDRFPVLEETYREVMEDLMDVQNAERVAREIEEGRRKICFLTRQEVPSPFSHNLLVRGSSDVLVMADRKEMLRSLYDSVMSKIHASRNDIQQNTSRNFQMFQNRMEGPEFDGGHNGC